MSQSYERGHRSHVALIYGKTLLTFSGLHADGKADWIFSKEGELWLNSNLIMQGWVYGPVGAKPGMTGWDVIIVNEAGKVAELYAMVHGPNTPSES
jgi:hypothetical protein